MVISPMDLCHTPVSELNKLAEITGKEVQNRFPLYHVLGKCNLYPSQGDKCLVDHGRGINGAAVTVYYSNETAAVKRQQ